jgi:hypothetical protein
MYVTLLLGAIAEGKLELTKKNLDKVLYFLDVLYDEFLNRLRLKDGQSWEKNKTDFRCFICFLYSVDEKELAFLCHLYST